MYSKTFFKLGAILIYLSANSGMSQVAHQNRTTTSTISQSLVFKEENLSYKDLIKFQNEQNRNYLEAQKLLSEKTIDVVVRQQQYVYYFFVIASIVIPAV